MLWLMMMIKLVCVCVCVWGGGGGGGGWLFLTIVTETNLALSTRHCNIDESSGICDSLLGAAFGSLLLLLGLNLDITENEKELSAPNVKSRSHHLLTIQIHGLID